MAKRAMLNQGKKVMNAKQLVSEAIMRNSGVVLFGNM